MNQQPKFKKIKLSVDPIKKDFEKIEDPEEVKGFEETEDIEETEHTEDLEKQEQIQSVETQSFEDKTRPFENIKNKEKILEKIGRGCLYLLVFLVPLFFLPWSIAPLEINKQILAVFLLLVAFICYLVKTLISDKIITYPKSLLSLAILIFLGALTVSTILSKALLVSLYGSFIQSDTLLNFLIGGLIFFLFFVFFQKKDLAKIFFAFLLCLGILTILGLLQLFNKFPLNPFGSVFSWGFFLAFGLVMIIGTLSLLKLSKVFKIILGLIGLLIGFALFILNYWIIWLVVFTTMIILTSYKFYKSKVFALGEIFLPTIIMMVALLFILTNQFLPSLISVPNEIRPNLKTTLEIANDVFKGSPAGTGGWLDSGLKQIIFGSGPNTFSYNYEIFRPVELNQGNFWQIRFNQGFSFISTLLSTAGVLGFLALLFLAFAFLFQLFKYHGDKENIFLIVFLGTFFLITGWFLYLPNFTNNLFIFLGLGIIAGLTQSDEKHSAVSFSYFSPKTALFIFLAINLLIVLSLVSFYLVGQKYLAVAYYNKGLQVYYPKNDLASTITNLNTATILDPYSDEYNRVFSQVLILRVGEIINQIKDQSQIQENLSQIQNLSALAINTSLRATALVPVDSWNWTNLGSIYENLIPISQGAEVFAEENYRKAIELDPKNPNTYLNLARILLFNGKRPEAEEILKKAVSLKADYAPTYYYLGVLYYQNNQIDEARQNFEQAVNLNPNYNEAKYFLELISNK